MTNCLFKPLLVLLCMGFCIHTAAQQPPKPLRHQLTLISENDNYTFRYKDRYYTNGFMIRYSRALDKTTATIRKKVFTAEAGQLIFNPYRNNVTFARTLDRPYTGLLYIQGGVAYFSSKGHMWRWQVQGGVVGAAALGEQVQRWHHKNFGLPYPYGWETQLPSGFGLNLHGAYYHRLLPTHQDRWIQLYAGGELAAGNLLTQAGSSLLVKLGVLEKSDRSNWWEARLQSSGQAGLEKKWEWFVYLQPRIAYQVYNATVQGSLFNKNSEVYTTGIQPYVFSQQCGMVFSKDRYTVQAGFTYQTREARTMRTHQKYGTIQLGYRFR